MESDEVIQIAMAYAERLKEVLDNIDSVYLFGSRVSRAKSESSIDVAVISKDFISPRVDRLKLLRIRREIDSRIEPHPFNTSDFNLNNYFAKSIIETGIKVI